MNLQNLLQIYTFEGKEKGDAAVKRMLETMTVQERKDLVNGICKGVNDIAKQFTAVAVDHAVETNHPFAEKSKQDTAELMTKLRSST